MSIYEQIARRLKTEREGRNLSQQELASKLGVAPNTVSRWETGTYKPRLDDLGKIAAALDLHIGALIPQNDAKSDVSLQRLIDIARMLDPGEIEEVELGGGRILSELEIAEGGPAGRDGERAVGECCVFVLGPSVVAGRISCEDPMREALRISSVVEGGCYQ